MKTLILSATLLMFWVATGPAEAQPAAKAEKAAHVQNWFGTLDLKMARLRMLLEVTTKKDGTKEAIVYSVDQGNAKLQTDSFSEDGGKLKFTMDKVKASFAGDISADTNTATGKFTQFGISHDFTLRKSDGVPQQEVIAAWVGDLEAGPQVSRIQFREIKSDDGEKVFLFDSLTERMKGITAEMSVEGNKTTFEIPAAKATFVGTFNEDRTQISGEWSQLGKRSDLVLTKKDKAEEAMPRKRPQTPKEPFSYQSEEVEFENKEQGVTLSGTLTYPSEGGPFPCVILVTGSGPQNRDENIFEHKPFAVIANHLAEAGIATLRYDDRGVGKSTGSFMNSTSADFAKDGAAAIDFLKINKHVDVKRIGIVGHSEGGLIATMLAAQRDDLAHVVLMAGTGVAGDKIIIDQTDAILKANEASTEFLAEQQQMMKELLKASMTDGVTTEQLTAIAKKYPRAGGDEESLLATQLSQFGTPWFQYFLRYDPGPDLAKASCPVLALIGEKDLQVTTGLNGPAIQEALATNPHAESKYVELPGLNHLFQSCTTGSPSEYDSIEQTLDESLLVAITDWVKNH